MTRLIFRPVVTAITGCFYELDYSSMHAAMSRAKRRSKMGLHTFLFLPQVIDSYNSVANDHSTMFALAGALLLLIVSARYNRRTQF